MKRERVSIALLHKAVLQKLCERGYLLVAEEARPYWTEGRACRSLERVVRARSRA